MELCIGEDVEDVPVGDDVGLALLSDLARGPSAFHVLMGDEVVISDRFRANKASCEVGVNLTRGLHGRAALGDGPGSYFIGAHR